MKGSKLHRLGMPLLALALTGAAHAADRAPEPKAQPDAPAVAVVNGVPIKGEYAGLMLHDRGISDAQATDGVKQEVRQRLVVNELLVQQAQKMGFDKNPEVSLRTEMMRRDMLATAYLNWYLSANPIPEEKVQAEYEARKARLAGAKEYSLRHIVVADKAQAESLIGQLAKGADFAALAESQSLDQGGSRNYGGSLGWISLETADSALVDAASKLRPGQLSQAAVQTRFGWHVIRLDAARDVRILPFDAVKEQLRQYLQQQQIAQLQSNLQAGAAVDVPAPKMASAK